MWMKLGLCKKKEATAKSRGSARAAIKPMLLAFAKMALRRVESRQVDHLRGKTPETLLRQCPARPLGEASRLDCQAALVFPLVPLTSYPFYPCAIRSEDLATSRVVHSRTVNCYP